MVVDDGGGLLAQVAGPLPTPRHSLLSQRRVIRSAMTPIAERTRERQQRAW